MAKGLSAAKAKKILKDGYVKGKPLTAKQKKYFGAIANGATPLKAINGGWLDKFEDGGDVPKAQLGRILKAAKNMYQGAKKFDSSIDWAKWNKEIPNNKALMNEYNAIEKAAKADGTWMKNLDGTRFPGAEEFFIQSRSKNFKNWYTKGLDSKEADKVYNEFLNSPEKLYHSTKNTVTQDEWLANNNSPFSVFDSTKGVRQISGTNHPNLIFTSPNLDQSRSYGFSHTFPLIGRGNNTKVIDYNGRPWNGDKKINGVYKSTITGQTPPRNLSINNQAQRALSQNYSNIEARNILDYGPNIGPKAASIPGNTQVFFNSNDLKSVLRNDGMFSELPNMYKAIVPGAIGLGAASQMTGPVREDGQFKNGGWLDKFGMGGNLSGASGMMYSRNSGTTPEEPKKAQNGVDYKSVKNAIRNVESLDGKLMWNPESTATGLYGQRFSEIKNDYPGNRKDFVKDTVAQNEFFKRRFYDGLEASETTPLLQDANDLYNDYSPQIKNFPYSKEDIAVLSNFIGRGGTRKYLGYAVRDGKPLAEALPNIYGPSAKQSNKTPEEYLELARRYYKTNELKNGGRCWPGYKTVSGKTPFSKGSCQKAQDGTSMISQYEEPAWYEKLLDYAASPMTTLGYLAKGQDLPDRLPINVPGRSEFDNWTFDTINPAAYIKYGASAKRNFEKGEYFDATFDALGAIPILPAFLKKGKKPVKAATKAAKKVGKFDSSIDWGKWNKEIPENKALMKEYNAIEQAAKLDGTWMTDIDSNIFGDVERINLRDAIEFSETGLLRGKEANDSYKKIHKQLLTKLLKLKEQAVGTPEQFVQRRSKNYKKAFPNDPLKTYRGAVGTETYNGPLDGKVKNLGTVFTTGKNEAIHYAPKGDQGLLELLYNQSDNSLDFSAKGSGWNGLRTDLIPESNLKSSISTRNTTTDDIASRIEDLGIDYVNIRNIYDGVDMPLETIFNHRKGNYLKSAKGNNGMFDMTNPNIYKAIVPGAIGTAAASQMTGPVQEDGQFKNGGGVPKAQYGRLLKFGKDLLKGAKKVGKDVETEPLRDLFIQPNIYPISGPLPKNMEPYLSRKVYPFNKEQEVFESFLSTDRQLKNIDSKSINYDADGNIIPKAQIGKMLKKANDLYKIYKSTNKVVDAANTVKKTDKVVSNSLNPLEIADQIIPRFNVLGPVGGDIMQLSPLNAIPFYGKTLKGKNMAFRKFGNSIYDVIQRQALSPVGGSDFRMGKNQIVSEGNWAAMSRPSENYSGVFEATFDFNNPFANLSPTGISQRNGVLITDKLGNRLPEIPLTEPGLSFNRRLPFSTRYVPIDKQKLIDNKPQLATFGPRLQSLAEKYGIGLLGAHLIGEEDTYNKYTIDPVIENTEKVFNDLKKMKSDDDNKDELKDGGWLSKYENGGVIEDDRGQWAYPGEITKINSNNITMKGVNYPVLGISDTGDKKMMQPGKDYKFDGNSVTEYPMAKDGKSLVELNQLTNFTNYNTPQPGGWLNKYN